MLIPILVVVIQVAISKCDKGVAKQFDEILKTVSLLLKAPDYVS